jgi:tetratricopeptide (TPR) repeat protein
VTLVDFRLNCAGLRSQEGDAPGARENLAAAQAIRAEVGTPAAGFESLEGLTLLDLGLPAEALGPLRRGLASHLDTGDVGAAASIAGSLARALALLGRSEEALAESSRGRSLASLHDIASQIWWRGASARSLAALGRGRESAALADEIVELLADVEYPQIEFHAHVDAAEGYRADGRLDDAARLLGEAIAVSEARGAHGFARQAADALAALTAGASG